MPEMHRALSTWPPKEALTKPIYSAHAHKWGGIDYLGEGLNICHRAFGVILSYSGLFPYHLYHLTWSTQIQNRHAWVKAYFLETHLDLLHMLKRDRDSAPLLVNLYPTVLLNFLYECSGPNTGFADYVTPSSQPSFLSGSRLLDLQVFKTTVIRVAFPGAHY